MARASLQEGVLHPGPCGASEHLGVMSAQVSEGAAEWSGRSPSEGRAGPGEGRAEGHARPAGGLAAKLSLLWGSVVTARSASGASWVANVFLLVAKAIIFAISNSKAVLGPFPLPRRVLRAP